MYTNIDTDIGRDVDVDKDVYAHTYICIDVSTCFS